jgi:hypothetical protein
VQAFGELGQFGREAQHAQRHAIALHQVVEAFADQLKIPSRHARVVTLPFPCLPMLYAQFNTSEGSPFLPISTYSTDEASTCGT